MDNTKDEVDLKPQFITFGFKAMNMSSLCD